jgi:hypothetical protein
MGEKDKLQWLEEGVLHAIIPWDRLEDFVEGSQLAKISLAPSSESCGEWYRVAIVAGSAPQATRSTSGKSTHKTWSAGITFLSLCCTMLRPP